MLDVSDISNKKHIYIMPLEYTCAITDLILEKEEKTHKRIKHNSLNFATT